VSLRWRLVLAIIGLVVLCLSAAVLAYVVWPRDVSTEQFRPAPTLFAPPGAALAGDWAT
jgi:hypothetical protein